MTALAGRSLACYWRPVRAVANPSEVLGYMGFSLAQLAEDGLNWQVISLLLEAGARPAALEGVCRVHVY